EGRWYRFHDLVREYANAGLDAEAKREAEQRHGRFVIAEMAQLNTLYQRGGENVVEALRRFDRVWAEAREAVVLARGGQGDPAGVRFCVDLPYQGAYLLTLRQHPRERLDWLTFAVAAARKIGERKGEAAALNNLGLAHSALGRPRKAIECYEQNLVITRD